MLPLPTVPGPLEGEVATHMHTRTHTYNNATVKGMEGKRFRDRMSTRSKLWQHDQTWGRRRLWPNMTIGERGTHCTDTAACAMRQR